MKKLFLNMNLNKKNIIVTGANRGIGAEIVKNLHKFGANVICCSRVENKSLTDMSLEINRSNENKLYNFFFDFSNEDQIISAANNICSKFDHIDGLVNNAGINHVSLFLMDKIEDIKSVFQINFFSQLIFSQIIIKKMINKKKGSIIFLSSKAATDFVPGRLAYSASKFSLINATKILSKELGRYKIRVNAIAPGLIDTDMSKSQLNEDEINEVIKTIPLKRMGTSENVADLVTFLCSEKSSYINGQLIKVDGGQY